MTDKLESPGKDLDDKDGFKELFSGIVLETVFPEKRGSDHEKCRKNLFNLINKYSKNRVQ